MMKKLNHYTILLFTGLLIFGSCKIEKDVLAEPIKNFEGKWRISKVVRNEEDITANIDSTGLRLTLKKDHSFSLVSNNIPFLANGIGKWQVDDPNYPFHISFVAKDSTDERMGDLSAPVDAGKRKMVITFSPGCYSNKYVYTLENMQ